MVIIHSMINLICHILGTCAPCPRVLILLVLSNVNISDMFDILKWMFQDLKYLFWRHSAHGKCFPFKYIFQFFIADERIFTLFEKTLIRCKNVSFHCSLSLHVRCSLFIFHTFQRFRLLGGNFQDFHEFLKRTLQKFMKILRIYSLGGVEW